jgi:hypothetical protein
MAMELEKNIPAFRAAIEQEVNDGEAWNKTFSYLWIDWMVKFYIFKADSGRCKRLRIVISLGLLS